MIYITGDTHGSFENKKKLEIMNREYFGFPELKYLN
jgi:hypothetical protein